jgi:hypothetical protein
MLKPANPIIYNFTTQLMEQTEQHYFEVLCQEVGAVFGKIHPGCPKNIRDWKGQEIADFQEELIQKVKGRISEKWFYTHIKSPGEKLPRIDMLNMLSQYAGYENWGHFKSTRSVNEQPPNVTIANPVPDSIPSSEARSGKILLIILALFAVSIGVLVAFSGSEHTYRCSFVDMDGHTPVHKKIRVTVLRSGESPVYAETDENGCLELNEKEEKLEFIISSAYLRPDTFIRLLNKKQLSETLQVRTDDYALMIHYFSQSDRKDWEKRRAQLKDMISGDARIVQVFADNVGMELYTREEFIDKLTMPIKSLKNLEITSVKYSRRLISELRFIQREGK